MKKIISLILFLCMILSLAACGKAEITMQEIYDASNLTALLEDHESVYVQYTESGKLYEEGYLTQDYTYSLYSGEYYGMATDFVSFTTDHAYYSYMDGTYTRSVLLSPDGLADTYRSEDDVVYVLGLGTVKDTIQSVEKKDGRITVTSFTSQEEIEASGETGLVSHNSEYVLDAKTRELISVKDVTEYDDGMVYNIVVDFIYDGEIPEGMKEFMEYEQQTEDLRTITVVSNPGAENEKIESVQVPKGLAVSLESDFSSDEAFAMYSDAACTESFVSFEDDNSDATIYVKWGE